MKLFTVICAAALTALLTSDVRAGGGGKTSCCGRCGCDDKVCQLVTKMTEKTKTVYACEDDCVCLPPPSHSCGGCGKGDACGGGCKDVVTNKCGRVRPVKKLVKYQRKVKACEHKWVVVSSCGCGGGAKASDAIPVPDVTVPPPPQARLGDEYLLTEEEYQLVMAQHKAGSPIRVAPATGVADNEQPVKRASMTKPLGYLSDYFK